MVKDRDRGVWLPPEGEQQGRLSVSLFDDEVTLCEEVFTTKPPRQKISAHTIELTPNVARWLVSELGALLDRRAAELYHDDSKEKPSTRERLRLLLGGRQNPLKANQRRGEASK